MLLTKLLFGHHWHRSTRRGRHLPGPAAVRMGSTPGLVVMRKDFCRNRQPCVWVLSESCIVRMPFAGFRRREEAEIASSKRKRLLGLRAVRMAFAGIASSEGERASLRPKPANESSQRAISANAILTATNPNEYPLRKKHRSFRRHGQAPYSNYPRSCGTVRGRLSMAP